MEHGAVIRAHFPCICARCTHARTHGRSCSNTSRGTKGTKHLSLCERARAQQKETKAARVRVAIVEQYNDERTTNTEIRGLIRERRACVRTCVCVFSLVCDNTRPIPVEHPNATAPQHHVRPVNKYFNLAHYGNDSLCLTNGLTHTLALTCITCCVLPSQKGAQQRRCTTRQLHCRTCAQGSIYIYDAN